MKAARWSWNVLAIALIGISGLAMTQFAATQETQPSKKTEAAQKEATEKKATGKKETEKDKTALGKKGLSIFMRMKLDASQKILAGLALEDYELIQEGADKLQEMSAAEKWRVTNDPFFREHSADFQKLAKRLAANAKDGKLEAAALTWMEATMQCIECHKWTRANLIAGQP